MIRYRLFAIVLPAILLVGCGFSSRYYAAGNRDADLSLMLRNMEEERSNPERRFIYMQEIIKALKIQGRGDKLNLFLTDYVSGHERDPFNAYYLYIVAEDYQNEGATPFATAYYDRIIEDYPDLLVHGTSIHYLCLSRLIKTADKPAERAAYYKQLLARFGDKVQGSSTYYDLARTYAELGEWDLEMQAYKNFLRSPDHQVPGIPDAVRQVTNLIDYYDYPNKSWAVSSLDDLVSGVRGAIEAGNVHALTRYRAKVGFFARSWEAESMPVDEAFLNDLGVFMNPQVSASDALDDSNSKEAYLKTTGWTYRIETWYFYFRKISFPEDTDVQGKWEWAGIYFGEKPFSGAGR